MNSFIKWLLSLVLIGLAGISAYTWIMLTWSYGSGERAGYVQKFSNRGYICKTWEGELAMVSMPGTMSEKFLFTVRDDAVAQKINANLGKSGSKIRTAHWIADNLFWRYRIFCQWHRSAG
ncbi:hypothetical protein [Polynucleobacter necessarius]|uniref:hypothetical protein n=1 Tax=Polynucleobacter necessarius TaxID=576610 RepID=UPI001E3DBD4E|nr:hypothetical protein [Polynucleobacter necessarius]